MLTPVSLFVGLCVGWIALLVPVVGIVLLYKATHPPVRQVHKVNLHRDGRLVDREAYTETRVLRWHERWWEPVVWLPLATGLFMLLLPLVGRRIVQYGFRAGSDEPVPMHGEVHSLTRPDGTLIHAEVFGPVGAPTLVLTHGWGTDGTEWFYAKRQLAGKFRLIVWDLPGLGQTESWQDKSFALDRMAMDLHAVLTLAAGKPVILVGHSIGGMINLTFCKIYPQELGTQVAGIVELDSSYTNPVRTTKNSSLNLALQKPVAEPLLHAMVPLSAVFRAMNWLSYQEGLLYLNNARSSFDGTETRGQLDLVSRYQFVSSPGIVARGTLAMFHWDMTPELPMIPVPVLSIVGKDDTTTLPTASEKMAETIPRGQLQILPIGRHYSLLESNQVVDTLIATFADGVLSRPK